MRLTTSVYGIPLTLDRYSVDTCVQKLSLMCSSKFISIRIHDADVSVLAKLVHILYYNNILIPYYILVCQIMALGMDFVV